MEILCLIDHRWMLNDDEREWCAAMLSEQSGESFDAGRLLQQMDGVLTPDDFATLAHCFAWFCGPNGAVPVLLRDLPPEAQQRANHWDLFPDEVLDAFGVIGCEPTLDPDAVGEAYEAKIKLLHPDALVGMEPDESERTENEVALGRFSVARTAIRMHFSTFGRNLDEASSRPAPPIEPEVNYAVWDLLPRARELADRIQQTVEATREIIQEAEQRIQSARADWQINTTAILSSTAPLRHDTERHLATARAHVASQGAEPWLADYSENANIAPARSSPAELQEVRQAVVSLGGLVGELLQLTRPRQIWRPDSKGETWLLIVVGVVGGIIGAGQSGDIFGFVGGFTAAYALAMAGFWLHNDLGRRFRSVSADVESGGRLALGLIYQFERQRAERADAELQSAEQKFRTEVALLDRSLQPQSAKLQNDIASLWEDAEFSCAEWETMAWDLWRPVSIPSLTARFGTLTAYTDDIVPYLSAGLDFTLPALTPFAEEQSLLLKVSGAEKEQAGNAIKAALARLIATIPPAKLRLTLIDPVALGSNVAGLMSLADYEESLVTSRAWSEPHHIEQRLSDLTEHLENVIQKYLRTDFKTIHDYNAAANEVAEPYRFIVVFDFPVNFTDTAARRLNSIVRNGACCGVYALIVCDTSKPLPYGFSLDELCQSASVIDASSGRPDSKLRWLDPSFQEWLLHLDSPPPPQILKNVIDTVGGLAKNAMRVEVPFRKLLQLSQLEDNGWWKATTTHSIRVPLGPTGARKLQYLVLGEGMGHHALVVGRPGSGKSNLMHVIITTLALTYSPNEIRLYLIDFKKGVEFKSYADSKLPHAEVIAIESEREFGLSVVERLDVELKRRGDIFRSAGTANIAEYRTKTDRQIPRVLLVVDEFQEFFTQDDHIARQTTLLLDRLVRQGRAFGIHIILGSQTLAGNYNLSRGTLDQMAVRIAMQCSEADSHLILSDDNPAARLLSRPGEAIYNSASGLIEGNNLFQVARFSEADASECLELVTKIASDSGLQIPVPIVFEGNELAHLADCRRIQTLLDSPVWSDRRTVELLLGDPIAIKEPVAAPVRRQSGSHLLVLSRDEGEGIGLCISSIISIVLQEKPADAEIFIANFAMADSEWATCGDDIEKWFPHSVKVLSRQQEVVETVEALAVEVSRRSSVPPDGRNIYLVIHGLHRVRVLRGDYNPPGDEGGRPTPAENFSSILRDGSEVGVHVIAWCDTYSNAVRVVERRMMTEFGLRVGGAMSADDSMGFFDDAAASRIDKPHRSLFLQEDRPGQLEKFRPYSIPPREWLEVVGRKLHTRCAGRG